MPTCPKVAVPLDNSYEFMPPYVMDMQSGGPRQLHDVSALGLTCTECGAPIDKLPFQPSVKQDGTYGKIYCKDCNRKRRSF